MEESTRLWQTMTCLSSNLLENRFLEKYLGSLSNARLIYQTATIATKQTKANHTLPGVRERIKAPLPPGKAWMKTNSSAITPWLDVWGLEAGIFFFKYFWECAREGAGQRGGQRIQTRWLCGQHRAQSGASTQATMRSWPESQSDAGMTEPHRRPRKQGSSSFCSLVYPSERRTWHVVGTVNKRVEATEGG